MAAALPTSEEPVQEPFGCICLGLCTSNKVEPSEETVTEDCPQDHPDSLSIKYYRKETPTPVQTQPTVSQPTGSPNPGLEEAQSHSPAQTEATSDVESDLGSLHEPYWEMKFDCPTGVAVSEEGEIFVAKAAKKMIQVLNLQKTRVHQFPEMDMALRFRGESPNSDLSDQTTPPETLVRQFPTVVQGQQKMVPLDVAVDGEGNLWVVGTIDTEDLAVQYDNQGSVLKKIDLQMTGWSRGVAVDTRRNHVLITQSFSGGILPRGEVLVFGLDGTLVKKIVGQQEKMYNPVYITVDKDGNVFVSDYVSHCVHMYNDKGQFLLKVGVLGGRTMGKKEGLLLSPFGICTDRAGNIIVADSGNSRVEMFDKTGKFLKHIATGLRRPHAVAMTPQDQLIIVDSLGPSVTLLESYLQDHARGQASIKNKEGTSTPVQTQPTASPEPRHTDKTVQSLPSATISASPETGVINLLRRETHPNCIIFGNRGEGPGQFNCPTGVVVSVEEEIFVADNRNLRIQVFTLQGTFIRMFTTLVNSPYEGFISPNDVALDGEGNLWVVGEQHKFGNSLTKRTAFFTGHHWAQQYTKDGQALRGFQLQSQSPNEKWDTGVAVDTRRNYILVTNKTTVDLCNPYNGGNVDFILQKETSDMPRHITVDGEGNILVSNQSQYNQCVYVFNKVGKFLFHFGGSESGEGQLESPAGICIDKFGNIIVTNSERMNDNNKTGVYIPDWTTGRMGTRLINTAKACVKLYDKTGKFIKDIAKGMTLPNLLPWHHRDSW